MAHACVTMRVAISNARHDFDEPANAIFSRDMIDDGGAPAVPHGHASVDHATRNAIGGYAALANRNAL